MKLADETETLGWDTAFWLLGVNNPDTSVAELGKLSLELGPKLRALAIMALLTEGDVNTFCHNLIRSALVRQRYLSRAHEEGLTSDHHFAAGRYEPLLDAIAASAQAVAQRLIELSPTSLREGHEYPDDFCYAQLLHQLALGKGNPDDCAPLLERMAETIDESQPARLGVVSALVARTQEDFDVHFEALLNEREATIEADKERGQLEEPHVVAQRLVFIEGLALLRLATQRGLATLEEYRYCPSLARLPMTLPFPGE